MNLRDYLDGVAVLVTIIAVLWIAARYVRGWMLPKWSGSVAALATAIIFLALLNLIAEALGSVGALWRAPFLVATLVVGIAVVVTATVRKSHGSAAVDPSARRLGGSPRRLPHLGWSAVVLVVLLIAVTPWFARTLSTLQSGILGYDSQTYHMPFAARFVQTGRVSSLHFTEPGLETPFHPANAELVHAVFMLVWRRDIVSPLLNLAWLAIALLAAWCIGRPRGTPALTLAAGAALIGTPFIASFDGGRGTNDIACLALFLAAVAFLLNDPARLPSLGLAAVAAGLALGTKLTMLVPVAALTVGVIVIAVRSRRIATATVWLLGLIVTGAYWYVRNLVVVGNPIPPLHVGVADLSLPSPTIRRAYPAYSVAHYATQPRVWRSWFLPGLEHTFGLMWPLLIALAVIGLGCALARSDSMLRMLGAVGAISLLGYLVTPQSAGGPEGRPVLFASDLRFVYPALALGLVLLPLAAPSLPRVGRTWVPACLAIVLFGDVLYTSRIATKFVAGALVVGFILIATATTVIVGWSTRVSRRVIAIACAVAVAFVVVLGYQGQRSYLARRYANARSSQPYVKAPKAELDALYRWARHTSDARIALAGLTAGYPLYGRDLSNHVQFIGRRGPHEAFDRVHTCREWRALVADGDYDYIVVSADLAGKPEPIEAAWTRGDPAAEVVLHAGTATVFRIRGALDQNLCPADSPRRA